LIGKGGPGRGSVSGISKVLGQSAGEAKAVSCTLCDMIARFYETRHRQDERTSAFTFPIDELLNPLLVPTVVYRTRFGFSGNGKPAT
jgi:hypothetical protein